MLLPPKGGGSFLRGKKKGQEWNGDLLLSAHHKQSKIKDERIF